MNYQPRILFVDDEELILNMLRRHFTDEDYKVLTASSGREGLKCLEENPIDVVVSDFRMPGMNGSEFLRHVSERWPDTVRLVLSGFTDMPALISLINDGEIFKFINKPWDMEELNAAIKDALEKHRELTEMRELLEESLAASEDLLSGEQKERESITKRNTVLEQNVEELKRYQAAFHCAGAAIFIFDSHGNLTEINFTAADMLRSAGEKQAEVVSDIELADIWRDMVQNILNGTENPGQKHRLPFGGITYDAILKLLVGYNGADGVVAVLWPCERNDTATAPSHVAS